MKSATTKSRRNGPDKRQKRAKTSPVGATCGRSGGVGVYIREAASITSALTEPSGMLALAKQPESSTVTFAPGEYWVEEEGGEASTAPNSRVSECGVCTRTEIMEDIFDGYSTGPLIRNEDQAAFVVLAKQGSALSYIYFI